MPARDSTKILLVDDQDSVRRGLRMRLSLEPDLEVVGEADQGPAAVQLASRLGPDVVVMDVRMPDGDGIAATRAIRRACPAVAVVILTLYDDPASRAAAADAGAAAFVAKHEREHRVIDAIRRAAGHRPARPGADRPSDR